MTGEDDAYALRKRLRLIAELASEMAADDDAPSRRRVRDDMAENWRAAAVYMRTVAVSGAPFVDIFLVAPDEDKRFPKVTVEVDPASFLASAAAEGGYRGFIGRIKDEVRKVDPGLVSRVTFGVMTRNRVSGVVEESGE